MMRFIFALMLMLAGTWETYACQQYTFNPLTQELDCVSTSATTPVTYTNILSHGGISDGTGDNTAAINTALGVNGTVFFPCGTYTFSTKISLSSNQALIGASPANIWRGGSCTRLVYSGSDAALEVKPLANIGLSTITVSNMEVSGTSASGSADGIRLDGTASAAYIEGVRLIGVAIANFPRYQLHLDGNVFMVYVTDSLLYNPSRPTGDHLYYGGTGGVVNYRSQVEFSHSRLVQYASTKWAINESLVTSMTFTGSTVAGAANAAGVGANGIKVNGGITLNGSHLEGFAKTVSGIGLQYTGANSAWINGTVLSWMTGVQIGDTSTKTNPALNAKIMGNVGNNTTDVQIVDGGQRVGCAVLGLGQPVGATTVTDSRFTVDGVKECMVQKEGFVLDNIPGTITHSNIASGSKQGNGSKVIMFGGGTPATNDCAKFDANGNIISFGGACGGGGGSGEANTASNVGVGGVGPFKQKTAFDLEFKNFNAGSNKVTVTNDAGNSEVDIDVAEANLSLSNIGGSLNATQIAAGSKQGNGTKVQMFGTGTPANNDCAKFDANGNIVSAGAACGAGSGSPNVSGSFTGQTSVPITHSLATTNVVPVCYDATDKVMEYGGFQVDSTTQVTVTFLTAATGRCVINGSGGGGGGSGGGGSINDVTADNGIVVTDMGAGVRRVGFNTLVIPRYIPGSATIDFANITAGSKIVNTFTLVGAQTNQTVIPGRPSGISSDLVLEMWVSAVDTISVKLYNPTGGSIDPPSATYTATIITTF